MKAKKSAIEEIRDSHIGSGFLCINVGNGEVKQIDVSVGKDGIMRRSVNGASLFPITTTEIDIIDGKIGEEPEKMHTIWDGAAIEENEAE